MVVAESKTDTASVMTDVARRTRKARKLRETLNAISGVARVGVGRIDSLEGQIERVATLLMHRDVHPDSGLEGHYEKLLNEELIKFDHNIAETEDCVRLVLKLSQELKEMTD